MSDQKDDPKDSENLPPLEIDDSGLEEALAKQNIRKEERLLQTSIHTEKHQEQLERMALAMDEAAASKIDWHKVGWKILSFILVMLTGYFVLSAFFDFINFIAGVRILAGGLKQILVMGALYFVGFEIRKRMTEEQAAQAWQYGKYLAGIFILIALTYLTLKGLNELSGIAARKTPKGIRWNTPFLYLLCVLGVMSVSCFFLAVARRKTILLLEKIDTGALSELPRLNRHQLFFIKYATEGLILNIGLMAFFQLAFGADVPRALINALKSPSIFLFYFLPFFIYVFFRTYFRSFTSD